MLENIKKWSMVLGTVMLLASCSKDMEDVNPSSTLGAVSSDAAKVANTTSYSFGNLRSSDGMTWSFDVQRSGDKTGANANTVVLGLYGCDGSPIALTSANVTSLSISGANGTQLLIPAFSDDSNNACNMSKTPSYVSFEKFNANLKDNTVYTFTLTLNSAIQVTKADVGVRAGNLCYPGYMEGPGCTTLDTCGEGQGTFHKVGSWEGYTVTLGGHIYTEADGLSIMTPNGNSTGGLKDSRAAFSQGATVMLNRQMKLISADAYAAQIADINAYLSTLNKLTTYDIAYMPHGNKAAKDAAGYIGNNIDKNCEE